MHDREAEIKEAQIVLALALAYMRMAKYKTIHKHEKNCVITVRL